MKPHGLIAILLTALTLVASQKAAAKASIEHSLALQCSQGVKNYILILGEHGGFGLKSGLYQIDSERSQLIHRYRLTGRSFESGQTVYEMTTGTSLPNGKIRLLGFDARLATLHFSKSDSVRAMIEADDYMNVECINGTPFLTSGALAKLRLISYVRVAKWE